MNMLLEMLSRCPRYLSQGPAELMWSVVHFPWTLIRIGASLISFPSHLSNGVSSCRRLLKSKQKEKILISLQYNGSLCIYSETSVCIYVREFCVCTCWDQHQQNKSCHQLEAPGSTPHLHQTPERESMRLITWCEVALGSLSTLLGSSSPVGGSSLNCSPPEPVRVSVRGLNLRSPASARAVTI